AGCGSGRAPPVLVVPPRGSAALLAPAARPLAAATRPSAAQEGGLAGTLGVPREASWPVPSATPPAPLPPPPCPASAAEAAAPAPASAARPCAALLRSPRLLAAVCGAELAAATGVRGEVLQWPALEALSARLCGRLCLRPFPEGRLRAALAACGRGSGELAASEFPRFFELCLLASDIAEGHGQPQLAQRALEDDSRSVSSATTAPPKAALAEARSATAEPPGQDASEAAGTCLKVADDGKDRLRFLLLHQARPLKGGPRSQAAPQRPVPLRTSRRLMAWLAAAICSFAGRPAIWPARWGGRAGASTPARPGS
ncbi:unnamed protein product, partial [Prorocentrum cordatum]